MIFIGRECVNVDIDMNFRMDVRACVISLATVGFTMAMGMEMNSVGDTTYPHNSSGAWLKAPPLSSHNKHPLRTSTLVDWPIEDQTDSMRWISDKNAGILCEHMSMRLRWRLSSWLLRWALKHSLRGHMGSRHVRVHSRKCLTKHLKTGTSKLPNTVMVNRNQHTRFPQNRRFPCPAIRKLTLSLVATPQQVNARGYCGNQLPSGMKTCDSRSITTPFLRTVFG